MLWTFKKLKLEIFKINNLKTTNRDRKKATKQDSRYCSVEHVIHMTGDTVQLALIT